jgi:phosphate transport system substrate-binding protein
MKRLILSLAVLGLCLGAFAQEDALRDSATVQKARNAMVKGKGNRTFYPADYFNLDDLPPYVPKQEVTGTIRFWGSNYFTDGNLGKYWADGFHHWHPGVVFDFHLTTAAAAIPALMTDTADIAPCRKITWKELLGFQRTFSHDPLEVTVVHGSYNVPGWSNALVIVVNKDNPISQLSLDQLDGIFGSERSGGWVGTEWHPEFARGPEKNLRTWGDLGLKGEWADKPIHVFGLNLQYQQATDMSRWFLKGSDKWNEKLKMYANYARRDGTLAIGAKMMVDDVGSDKYAIGYGSANYVAASTKIIPISPADGTPAVRPDLDSCRAGTYPLHDEVYFYVNQNPGAPIDPKVREFMRYVLSREGQAAVARDGKYLPLPAAVLQEQLKKID